MATPAPKTHPETLRTLPGDDVRQLMWRFAERYDLQMLVQSARGVARGPVARLVAEGGRTEHEWTARKNELLAHYDASGITASFMEPHLRRIHEPSGPRSGILPGAFGEKSLFAPRRPVKFYSRAMALPMRTATTNAELGGGLTVARIRSSAALAAFSTGALVTVPGWSTAADRPSLEEVVVVAPYGTSVDPSLVPADPPGPQERTFQPDGSAAPSNSSPTSGWSWTSPSVPATVWPA